MTDIAASIGISQIHRKNQILSYRHQLIDYYLENKLIKEMAFFGYIDKNLIPNGFTFTILHDSRNKIKQLLLDKGIDTRIMWPHCVDQLPVYHYYPTKKVGELKNAQRFSQRCLSLPLHWGVNKPQVDYIISIIEESISTVSNG